MEFVTQLDESDEPICLSLLSIESESDQTGIDLLRLETRIRHAREKLSLLIEEIAHQEALVGEILPTVQPILTLNPPAWIDRLSIQGYGGDPLSLLGTLASDLLDLQTLVESRLANLVAIRDSWEKDWNEALAKLGSKEEDLTDRERGLAPRQLELVQQTTELRDLETDLERRKQLVLALETKLQNDRQMLERERERQLGALRARLQALEEQHRLFEQLKKRWEQEYQTELGKLKESRVQSESARAEQLALQDQWRVTMITLDQRERRLVEREWALYQAKAELLARVGGTEIVDKELRRVREEWDELHRRPGQLLEAQQKDLARRAEQLESFRIQLLMEREDLEHAEHLTEAKRLEYDQCLVQMQAERLQQEAESRGIKNDREQLLRVNQDLREQIERLICTLLETQPDREAA